ncbi:MAG: thiamine phosphate synthase [Clostridiales bacterium]|nr:thiamine phosphate synthase [Clostridiales bacterium]
MCKTICVTNRKLAKDFLPQMRRVVRSGVDAVILREKDLSLAEYEKLAAQVKEICDEASVPLIIHSWPEAAINLGIDRLHMPLDKLLGMDAQDKKYFRELGASVHSVEEARAAQEAGATYVTAGHVFTTDCKKGVPPRGIPFLRDVCKAVDIPVLAIGGITPGNMRECTDAGAAGVCLMSYCMKEI